MERDQIEEAKNRRVHKAGTIATLVSMFEERKQSPPGFPVKKRTPAAFRLLPAAGALHFCRAEKSNSDTNFHAA